MSGIGERVVHVDGVRTFYREVAGEGTPTLFVHGNPTSSRDWTPFLERLHGPGYALDLPGWGHTERPGLERFDHSMWGLGDFVARFADAVGIAQHSLVVHDWGGVGLIAAQRRPALVERLVVIDAVPLLPGYRWHWIARFFWRRRVLGELFNRAATKSALRLISRQASPRPGPLPDDFVDWVWDAVPPGSWPEQLALYRSADPDRLAAAGAGLAELRSPALVVWGAQDPYIGPEWAAAYAERLANAELAIFDGAGHWPWLDRPEIVERVVGFLAEPRP